MADSGKWQAMSPTDSMLARVDLVAGEVYIDWSAVESAPKTMDTNAAMAALMLAIRNGTWKPL